MLIKDLSAFLLKDGKIMSLADIIIAATALEHRLKLVTRNVKHFSRMPWLRILSEGIREFKSQLSSIWHHKVLEHALNVIVLKGLV